jgi:hypothetical protein
VDRGRGTVASSGPIQIGIRRPPSISFKETTWRYADEWQIGDSHRNGIRGFGLGAGAGSPGPATTGGLVVSGADAGPGGEVSGSGEQAHVQAAFGDQDLGGSGLDARDRGQRLDDLGVRA